MKKRKKSLVGWTEVSEFAPDIWWSYESIETPVIYKTKKRASQDGIHLEKVRITIEIL